MFKLCRYNLYRKAVMAKPSPSTDMGTTDGIDTENGFFCMDAIFLRAANRDCAYQAGAGLRGDRREPGKSSGKPVQFTSGRADCAGAFGMGEP